MPFATPWLSTAFQTSKRNDGGAMMLAEQRGVFDDWREF
jgi:hypothetical protein